MSSVDFSVIICAYTENRWNELLAAVDSIRHQTLTPREIIVIIDHNPALLARAQECVPGVILAENSGEQGLSSARNTGIALAQGTILAFMDEDATAQPDWLERLAASFDDGCVLGVGGAIEPNWVSGQPGWFPAEYNWVIGCTYTGMPRSIAPVRNLIGCNMAFRRDVFSEVGGFRDGIGRIGTRPLGCEETELCIRARQQRTDGVFIYDPSARVNHRVPANRGTWQYFRSRCYAEGLSKALVAHLVGAGDGLSNERSYTLRTLPAGVLRGLADGLFHRDLAGFGRAASITAGLMIATAGYLVGKVQLARKPSRPASSIANEAESARSGARTPVLDTLPGTK